MKGRQVTVHQRNTQYQTTLWKHREERQNATDSRIAKNIYSQKSNSKLFFEELRLTLPIGFWRETSITLGCHIIILNSPKHISIEVFPLCRKRMSQNYIWPIPNSARDRHLMEKPRPTIAYRSLRQPTHPLRKTFRWLHAPCPIPLGRSISESIDKHLPNRPVTARDKLLLFHTIYQVVFNEHITCFQYPYT